MGPKVEAVCRFVEATGRRAAIGRLERSGELVDGTAGTQVDGRSPAVEFAGAHDAGAREQRAVAM